MGQLYPAGAGTRFVAIGDLNGDGNPDLATASAVDGTVGVLLGTGNGTFVTPTTFPVSGSICVRIVDLNGDDRLDLASAAMGASVLLGQ